MRLFLGDQSVVITKVQLCTLRRRTVVFAVFQVLVRTRCMWCGFGELVGLRCVRDYGVRGLVGVAAPRSDPLGSSIVEILRVLKAGM